jgi:hypothetical protein
VVAGDSALGVPAVVGRRQTRPLEHTLAVSGPSRDRGCASFVAGGGNSVGKGCDREGSDVAVPRVLLPVVRGTEKERQTSTGVGLIFSKQFSEKSSFQDGYPYTGSVKHPPGRLGDFSRPIRRVFSRGDSSAGQEVASFRVARSSLPIQGSSVRPQSIAVDFHHCCEISGKTGESSGRPAVCLPGRLVDFECKQSEVSRTHRPGVGLRAGVRFSGQSQEIRFDPCSTVSFSGNVVGHSGVDSGTKSGKGHSAMLSATY